MQLEIAALSKAGGRAINEDACGVWSSADGCFCVLSDGAGGHGGGDVASKLAVSRVLEWFRRQPRCTPEAVEGALMAANRAIVEQQKSERKLADMRATIVVLALDTLHGIAFWGHLGDSRLYCFRGGRLLVQTRDHSVVQSMVDAGYVKPGDLRTTPHRSRLLGALGDAGRFEPTVERQHFSLADGDAFLLCTDGCWEFVEEAEMGQALLEANSGEDWLRVLEQQVLSHGKPGQDNYSAIAIWCRNPAEETQIRLSRQ